MFAQAIKEVTGYTRPLHGVIRYYQSTDLVPWAATLFVVNADGWALTCKHVAAAFKTAEDMQTRKVNFKKDLAAQAGKKKEKAILRDLERAFNLSPKSPWDMVVRLMNCGDGIKGVTAHFHDKVDLALLKFDGQTKSHCKNFPRFAKDSSLLQQGRSICRLGFPFPEFTNFAYNAATDSIDWTTTGKDSTPTFPNDGILTRFLANPTAGGIFGFETSTPGIKGQSGGPVFDKDGLICGMQAATGHHDLDFDVNLEVRREHQLVKIKNHAFLHVGHCIHLDLIKTFMRDKGVAFVEA